jgi:hypothetical protein
MATSKKAARAAAMEAALSEGLRFHAAAPRLAAPNADLTSDVLGTRIALHSDEFGIVRPTDSDAVRLADALGLPVLRSADQEPSTVTAEPTEEAEEDTEDTAEPAAEEEG